MAGEYQLFAHTPRVRAVDPRGLVVRGIDYLRDPGSDAAPATLASRTVYDACGRYASFADPRQHARGAGHVNETRIASLADATLRINNTDSGWRLRLPGAGGEVRHAWAAGGEGQATLYDDCLRPVARFDSDRSGKTCCTERMAWGPAKGAGAGQAGRLIRIDDPTGTHLSGDWTLTGRVQRDGQRFLPDLDPPDWPEREDERDAMVLPESWTTDMRHDATGLLGGMTDAGGHARHLSRDTAGRIFTETFTSPGEPDASLLASRQYDAHGRRMADILASDVEVRWTYSPSLSVLQGIVIRSGAVIHQNLTYTHDPARNVTSCHEAVRGHASGDFAYDTLYRLRHASGTEADNAMPDNSEPGWMDMATAGTCPYDEWYDFDAGSNMVRRLHQGAFKHEELLVVADDSNRASPRDDTGQVDPDVAYDRNGQLLQLDKDTALHWNARLQLAAIDHGEPGVYRHAINAGGLRARTRTPSCDILYLRGLDRRQLHASGATSETIYALSTEAVVIRPDTTARCSQLRVPMVDALRSHTGVLDGSGSLLSIRWYRPFGETGGRCTSDSTGDDPAWRGYAGKERGVCGLHDYGLRFYAPWHRRWLNTDPIGRSGGDNLFAFAGCNPTTYIDVQGAVMYRATDIPAAEVQRLGFPLSASSDSDGETLGVMEQRGAVALSARRQNAARRGAIRGTAERIPAAQAGRTRRVDALIHVAGAEGSGGAINAFVSAVLARPFDALSGLLDEGTGRTLLAWTRDVVAYGLAGLGQSTIIGNREWHGEHAVGGRAGVTGTLARVGAISAAEALAYTATGFTAHAFEELDRRIGTTGLASAVTLMNTTGGPAAAGIAGTLAISALGGAFVPGSPRLQDRLIHPEHPLILDVVTRTGQSFGMAWLSSSLLPEERQQHTWYLNSGTINALGYLATEFLRQTLIAAVDQYGPRFRRWWASRSTTTVPPPAPPPMPHSLPGMSTTPGSTGDIRIDLYPSPRSGSGTPPSRSGTPAMNRVRFRSSATPPGTRPGSGAR